MILDLLQAMSEIYGRPISTNAAKLFLSELSDFTENELELAIRKCLRELKTFPTVSDIISRIDDGRPGAEEAWSIVPKSENESVVWTEEIKTAFFCARELLQDDPIAARMTFKEVYENELKKARLQKSKVIWSVSLGHDKSHRETVILNAINKLRLSHEEAINYLPYNKEKNNESVKRIENTGLTQIKEVIFQK